MVTGKTLNVGPKGYIHGWIPLWSPVVVTGKTSPKGDLRVHHGLAAAEHACGNREDPNVRWQTPVRVSLPIGARSW